MTEEWRSVVGYEGLYEVSDLGQVRSLDREVRHLSSPTGTMRIRGKLLKISKKPGGHDHLTLYEDGIQTNHMVHKLVAEAFLGPCPVGLWALHRNDDHDNNTLPNLYYGTPKQNGEDKVRNGSSVWGGRHHAVSVDEATALAIWQAKGKMKVAAIARKHNVTVSLVSHIHHGWSWNNLTGMPNPRT